MNTYTVIGFCDNKLMDNIPFNITVKADSRIDARIAASRHLSDKYGAVDVSVVATYNRHYSITESI